MSMNQSVKSLLDNGFKPSGIAANEYDIEIKDGVSLCVWFEKDEVEQIYIDNFDAGFECQLPVIPVEKIIELKNALTAKAKTRLNLYIHSLEATK